MVLINPSNQTITQYNPLVGAANNLITNIAPGASGTLFQSGGASANPAYTTATYPSTATGTGTILRANGTNWVATTATYPATTTVNQLLYSSATNTVTGLATANNAVLNTNGSGVPSITTYPQITGLGIGASPGSTAGITFDATNFMTTYATTTYTPTLTFGGGSTGITYTTRVGSYIKIGRFVCATFNIILSNKGSSAGVAEISLPFTASASDFYGSVLYAVLTFTSTPVAIFLPASTNAVLIPFAASGAGNNVILNTNCANTTQIAGTICYVAST